MNGQTKYVWAFVPKAKIGVHKKVCQSPKWADYLGDSREDWQPTI